MFDAIEEKLKNSEKIVFVTGAGISQESGIPTFRGKEGLWRKYDPMKLATIDAFYDDPKLVWEWYEDRRRNMLAAEPNPGHKAIAELEEYAKVVVLTQNIDGFHQKAGSTNVLELHGSIIRIKCTVCDFKDEVHSRFEKFPPMCKCGEILRPDVVWFGEALHTLPIYAKQNNALLIEVNPENTIMSADMDLSLKITSANALPHLVSIFKRLT